MIEHNGTNFQWNPEVLAAREGHGLLSGLLRCSRCGKKLHVRYWGKSGTHARYLCMGDYNSAGSYCIGFAGKGSDAAVSQEILNTISVAGVNANFAAVDKCNTHDNDKQQALQRQLEQLNYEAQRAFSQYDQADPSNRLVVDTLEKRWNEKLEQVEDVQKPLDAMSATPERLNDQDRQRILSLGEHFEDTWNHPECPMRLKKQIVRLVIKEIMVDLIEDNTQIHFTIHWHNGIHTEVKIDRPRSAAKAHKTDKDDIEIIQKMASLHSDSEIAMVLGKHGRKTGKGNRWTSTRFAVARRKYFDKSQRIERSDNLMTMAQAKEYAGISINTIARLIDAGLLNAEQVVPYAPYAIERASFDTEPVLSIINHLKRTGKLILEGGNLSNQENLFK